MAYSRWPSPWYVYEEEEGLLRAHHVSGLTLLLSIADARLLLSSPTTHANSKQLRDACELWLRDLDVEDQKDSAAWLAPVLRFEGACDE